MNLSIVIPNYNGEDILRKNLPKLLDSVKNYQKGSIEIIISDDCSSDNSVSVIREFAHINPNIKFIQSEKNKGFSSSVNKGFKETKGDVVILLNTDVITNSSFLDPLIKHFSDDSVFAVGCMNESIEGDVVVLRGRGIGKWKRGFLMHQPGDLDKNNTLWISGGSGAFRKKIWDKLGGLDEIYNPFYWEDIDISYRAQRASYKTLFEKDSIVRHEHEKGAIKNKYTQSQIKRIAYRNQFIFVWKNADGKLLISHLFWLPYHLISGLKGDRMLVAGFFDALLRIVKVTKSRSKSRRQFILSDEEVMKKYVS